LSIKSKSLKLVLELILTLDFDLTTLELIFKSKSLALKLISTLELNSTLILKPVSSFKLVSLALKLFPSSLKLKSSSLLFIKGQEDPEILFKSESESGKKER
jgi:hypothetical protein